MTTINHTRWKPPRDFLESFPGGIFALCLFLVRPVDAELHVQIESDMYPHTHTHTPWV